MTAAEKISRALLDAMHLRRITRGVLAAKLKTPRIEIAQVLRDPRHNWSLATLEQWCEAIGCKLEVIVEDPLDNSTTIKLKGPIFAIFRSAHQ